MIKDMQMIRPRANYYVMDVFCLTYGATHLLLLLIEVHALSSICMRNRFGPMESFDRDSNILDL